MDDEKKIDEVCVDTTVNVFMGVCICIYCIYALGHLCVCVFARAEESLCFVGRHCSVTL